MIKNFRENFARWQADLNRYKELAAQKHYSGLKAIEDALREIGKQLAIRDSYEFLEALNNRKDAWLDTADAVHNATSFY